MSPVYFDNAATTALRPEVVTVISEALHAHFGNPSSTHSFGRSTKALIERARKSIATQLGAKSSEIYFTSGGTEADNLVLRCAVRDLGVRRIITSQIEHHAVLHVAEAISQELGVELDFVQLDERGFIDYAHLEELLSKPDTPKTLVSLMHVNNEIGNITDLEVVSSLCKKYSAYFHSDTVQSIGHFNWDLSRLPIHFITAAAHKFHGPKGIGFLFIRSDAPLKSLIIGGGQERGFRAGTESVHNILGMECAFTLAYKQLDQEKAYVLGLKKRFVEGLRGRSPGVRFNGASDDFERSTYTLVNVQLPIEGDKAMMLLFHLDLKGIACSQGSACQSGSNQGSHVLRALHEEPLKYPSLRFSFSIFNTIEQVDYAVDVLCNYLE